MISVITSVYNSSLFLPYFFNCVNNQFLKKFEIIFIDANSSDNSLDVLKNFIFRDGISVKILPQNSRITVYEAWNIGIKSSSNKYIVNWNTDDTLFPSALQNYTSYIHSFPDVDLFYGPCFVSSKQDHTLANQAIHLQPPFSHSNLIRQCTIGPFPLVKKSAIQSVGYFNEKYISSGDYDMWLKLSFKNFKFKKIPEAIGCYFHRPNSVSLQNMNIRHNEDSEIKSNYN